MSARSVVDTSNPRVEVSLRRVRHVASRLHKIRPAATVVRHVRRAAAPRRRDTLDTSDARTFEWLRSLPRQKRARRRKRTQLLRSARPRLTGTRRCARAHNLCAVAEPACGGRSRFCALSFRFTVAAKDKAEERASAAEARIKAAKRRLAAERSCAQQQQQRAAQLDKLHAATTSQQSARVTAQQAGAARWRTEQRDGGGGGRGGDLEIWRSTLTPHSVGERAPLYLCLDESVGLLPGRRTLYLVVLSVWYALRLVFGWIYHVSDMSHASDPPS